jgi:hypothetical protein
VLDTDPFPKPLTTNHFATVQQLLKETMDSLIERGLWPPGPPESLAPRLPRPFAEEGADVKVDMVGLAFWKTTFERLKQERTWAAELRAIAEWREIERNASGWNPASPVQHLSWGILKFMITHSIRSDEPQSGHC